MRRRQEKADGISIFDLSEEVVFDFARVLDLFLKGRHDPQRPCFGPLAEKLQKSKILIEALRRRLRPKKLRQFIQDQNQSVRMLLRHFLPQSPAINLAFSNSQFTLYDRFERLRGFVIHQRNRDSVGISFRKRICLKLLGHVREKM